MSQNRYAPPAVPVAEIESGSGTLERPRLVTLGIRVLWVAITIGLPGLAENIYYAPNFADGQLAQGYIAGLIVVCAVAGDFLRDAGHVA